MAKSANKKSKADEPAHSMKRLGRFEIPSDVMEQAPALVRRVMGECIIMRAEYVFGTQSVVYDAVNDAFEEKEAGDAMPVYDLEYDDETDRVTWTKQD